MRDDSVYSLSRDHEMVSLNKATGAIRWRRPLPLALGDYSRFPMGSVVESTRTAVIVGDYDVLALDRRTGHFLWRFSPENGYAPGMYLGAVTNDSVFAGSPGGLLHSIDLSNGRARWSLSVQEGHPTTVYQPIVDRGLVLAGFTVFERPTRGGIVAVEARTGVERWRAHFPESPVDAGAQNTAWAGGPVIWNHLVIAAASTGSIRVFDRHTGSLIHSVESPQIAEVAQDFLPMVVIGDRLLVGSLTGLVVAYRLPTFQERWRYSPAEAGSVLFGMTADRSAVLVPYAGGRVVALDVDGRVRWTTLRESGVFAWPPAVDRRHLYMVGERSMTAFLK